MLQTALPRVPFRRMVISHALRFNPATVCASRTLSLPHRDLRHAEFSTTPRRHATEEPSANLFMGTQHKFSRIIQERPELQQLVMDLRVTLQEEGLDVESGTLPAKWQVIRVLMKPNVRDAVVKVSAAFQEVGINPKEMMEELMAIQKAWAAPRSDV